MPAPVVDQALHGPHTTIGRDQHAGRRELQGFTLYVASYILAVIYVLWAVVPAHLLPDFGLSTSVTVVPRYWAVAGPMFAYVLLGCAYLIYTGANMTLVPRLDATQLFTDSYFAPAEDSGDHPQQPHTLPPLVDIPLDEVNRHLYARSRTSDCYM